jgi:phosphoribosylamine--glycine ligase
MKVLIIDQDGYGLDFCLRCAKAGHEVRWFIKPDEKDNPEVGKGFKIIERVNNWIGSVEWADIIIPTGNAEYMQKLEFFKKRGCPIFGPSVESARLEVDRQFGMDTLKEYGIEVPEYKSFTTLEEAKQHVLKTKQRFVFKTMGDAEDKSLSYCSHSAADMAQKIEYWQGRKMNPKGPVMLQEFIDGIEIGVSRWMGKKGFIGKPNENFEHKKLMPGNKGPNTGEMGTLMAYVNESKLFDETLSKLEKALVKMGHLGDVDLNFIIGKEGVFKGKALGLEWTTRWGIPAFQIMCSCYKGDPVRWMYDAATSGSDSTQFITEIAVGVVVGIPDMPYDKAPFEKSDGLPLYGITPKLEKYIHPCLVGIDKVYQMDGDNVVKRPTWVSKGNYLAVVTGTGKDVKTAVDRAYKVEDEIKVSDKISRNDIAKDSEKFLPELHSMGYATHFEYEKGKKGG